MADRSTPTGRIVREIHQGPRLPDLSRYDWAMLDIPLGYLLALLASFVWEVSLLSAIVLVSLLQVVVLVDVMFLHPPGPGEG